ncbi:SRPBCC domain-containing protein [Microtetraspora sp. NBRC 16547]|uniref:SRPBCC domain-containing protein n=1 Tax=Microtetraspora sp. NBRC 16547 TaxID=3030993 RepID=UPI002552E97E|nr:SRPBCC domain-containing protein [Microtetraspora sp. NBRC 16547]
MRNTGGITMTDYGSVSTTGDTCTLHFERRLPHPVERVWRAISEPRHLVEWLAEVEIEPRTGGRVILRWLATDEYGKQIALPLAHGVISDYKPPHVLQFDTDVHGILRWELEGDGSGCLLLFNAIGDYGDRLTRILAGWHAHLDFLADSLEGRAVDWPNWPRARWEVLHGYYRAR